MLIKQRSGIFDGPQRLPPSYRDRDYNNKMHDFALNLSNSAELKTMLPVTIKTFDLDQLLHSHYEKMQRDKEMTEYKKNLRNKLDSIV